MKSLARMYVRWPGISKDIEVTVRGCFECQINQATPTRSSIASMKLADTAMGKTALGLCWTCAGGKVPHIGGCTLKVD